MKRILLLGIVVASIFWAVFAGYELLNNTITRYAPHNIFSEEDEGVMLVHRLHELQNADVLSVLEHNPFIGNLIGVNELGLPNLKFFLSEARPVLIIENEVYWKERQLEEVQRYFNREGTYFFNEGRFLVVTLLAAIDFTDSPVSFFEDGDKKATANYWKHVAEDEWKRTDLYALPKGFYEYKTQVTNLSFGEPVSDIQYFSSVIPDQVEKYSFFERFYASKKDSVLAKSVMFDWLDKGFVQASFKGERFLVTDYQPKQRPSLVLLENSEQEDSVKLGEDIQSFLGFQLTHNFPSKPKGRIYVLELEDKSIITESKALAEKIMLVYSLGETLALNEKKRIAFFEGLPSSVNFRYVDATEKQSLTWNGDFIFEVSTLPPGDNLLPTSSENWSHQLQLGKVHSFTPIPDHIRGGNSLFVIDEQGKFLLLNQSGNLVWRGKLDSTVVGRPEVIDLYENKKHQLLINSVSSVYLIDLNGDHVASFPYRAKQRITSSSSVFKWNGTTRFLFGDEKGELVMLNQNGQELTIVQVGTAPIKARPYALNIGGNLRAWAINSNSERYLAYLETPARAESLGRSNAKHFLKSGSEVFGFYSDDKKLYREPMRGQNADFIGEGNLIKADGYELIAHFNNELFRYTIEGNLLGTQRIGFNEVGQVKSIMVKGVKYLAVYDYLENNIYLYNEVGDVLDGFPKEAQQQVQLRFQPKTSILEVYTLVNKALVCYKINL